MKQLTIEQALQGNVYPGRGILVGKSEDGINAVIAYFIMGRSENSRNRIFVKNGTGIRTQPYDPEKVTDPSLIIYSPVRVLDNATIVTNGDQTDTVYESLVKGGTFEEALRSRSFEPDAPNYTPRISGLVEMRESDVSLRLSILKSCSGNPESTLRQFFEYESPAPGEGFLIHTYSGDGSPLPSFEGEPVPVSLSGDIDTFTHTLWHSLKEDNKISLFTRFIGIKSGLADTRILNKNLCQNN